MAVTVVGIGQPWAGDDGVGPAVVEALRETGLPRGVTAVAVADPSDLVALLGQADDVIVVDAVVEAGAPGRLVELDPDERDPAEPLAVSSHGIGVRQAIALARALSDGRPLARTRILGVAIHRPMFKARRLTPGVAAALPAACAQIRAMLER